LSDGDLSRGRPAALALPPPCGIRIADSLAFVLAVAEARLLNNFKSENGATRGTNCPMMQPPG
jgi:hypothetical protein